MMHRRALLRFAGAGFAFGSLLGPGLAFADVDPAVKSVQELCDTLIEVMKQGPKLGFDGRYAKLDPVIRRVYNLPLMGRLSLGSGWDTLSSEQQQAFLDAFSKYSIATYASRFDDYSGERFEVDPKPSPITGGVIVDSKLVKTDGDPVVLNYRVQAADQSWKIVDVYLTGTISQLATQRSEFGSVLHRDGPQALVDLLNRRVEEMKKPS